MKRKALKGLLIVLLVLILCYFFSGTIKTLTTAKVQLAAVQRGKLRDQITLTGYLTFSDTEGITIDNPPSGIALTVTKIHVTKGSFVAAGDLLFETEISGIADSIREQEKIYQEAEKSLLALERQYATLRITRTDQAWIDAYDALLAAKQNSHDAHAALEVAAKKQEIALRDGRIPDGKEDAALLTAQAAADRADQEVESAQAAMDRASRIGISNDAYQYTMQSRSLNDTMNQANAEIIALRSIEGSMTQVRAAHPGYVLGIQVSEGSPWDGRTAAMILSAEDTEYLLRANITGVARTIQPGTAVVISGRSDNQIKSSVVSAGYDSSGNPYIDVSIGQSDIAAIGTAYRLMNTGVSFSINYVADTSTTLLPASAVRGTESNRYVFIVRQSQNAFGQRIYQIEQQPVTVLDESSEYVSVADLTDASAIAYMEDRAISEGSEVIPYD